MNNTHFHRLLTKQISKHLTEDCLKHEHFKSFIKSVNESYFNFERDKELFEHSSQLNEKEYAEINIKLKKEIKQRKF